MNNSFDGTLLSELKLHNPEPNADARVGIVSLPIPLGAKVPAGIAGLPTHGEDLAWWSPSRSGAERVARRRMLYFVGEQPFAPAVRLGEPATGPVGADSTNLTLRDVHKDFKSLLPQHSSELVLARGNVTFGLRMGLRWRDELHWWEWVRIEKLWSSPVVSAYRVGGVIGVVPTTMHDVFPDNKNIRKSEWLHRQNWLLGEVYLRCFANGVVQLYCRHVNGHYYDEGRHQKDITPVIGFTPQAAGPVDRPWVGTAPLFQLGTTKLNLTDCARLVSAGHPGSLKTEGDLVVFQPYTGVEIGGDSTHLTSTDGTFIRASERLMPRGVARTVRFNLSLGATAPVITRFTTPDWWNALSGDLWSDGVLPVRDAWDARIEASYTNAIERHNGGGRFDECYAAIGREGETPFVQFMYAYRTGNLEHWRRALSDAYHIADIAFDHSTETIRMHNYPFDGSTSPALFRILGMLYGYLETGDPYLRECSESTALHFFCLDRHHWPRNAYGRDAMGVRGLVFLADYLGSEQYRQWAREALGRVIQCQLPDGGYHDQGGGTGIHALGQLPVKPWMANMANNPIIDYLERWPEDPQLWEAVVKYGDFLVAAGTQSDGSVRWPYQVSYGDSNYDPVKEFFSPGSDMAHLPDQTANTSGYEARSLCVITRQTGAPKYFDAWLKFYDKYWHNQPPDDRTWSIIKSLWHLPYAQAHAWNARWHEGRVEITPLPSLYRTELEGTIHTPRGPVQLKLRRTDPKDAASWSLVEQNAPPGVAVVLQRSQAKRE